MTRPDIPPLDRRPTHLEAQGETVVDDYAWLKDRSDPALLSYLDAERSNADAVMASTADLQAALRAELAGRVRGHGAEPEVPAPAGRYRFEVETAGERGDDGWPVLVRIDPASAERIVVLDLNEVAGTEPFVSVGRFLPSPDGARVAYTLDWTGDERQALSVVDLSSGSTSSVVDAVRGFEWTDDSASLYYIEGTEGPRRGAALVRLDLDTSARTTVRVEDDRSLSLGLGRSTSGELLLLESSPMAAGRGQVETLWLPADGSARDWRMIVPRSAGITHRVDHAGGERVDARVDDISPFGRLVDIALADPETSRWREVIGPTDGCTLDDIVSLERGVALIERRDGLPHAVFVERESLQRHDVDLDELGCVWSIDADASKDSSERVVFSVTSLVRPPTAVSYDIDSRRFQVDDPQRVDGFDTDDYELLRTFATADDGTLIPIELVRRKDANGRPAVMLYGYGCYGYSEEPEFNAHRLSLIDRGVAFAVAHPRGGGEYGTPWHDAGRLLDKKTTWSDFVAAGRHLVETGLCAPDRLVIAGGSAGGTLVTAAVNLAPDLFRAVVAWVPFADPFFVQLDESMPFTVFERYEWGDPYESRAELDNLRGHCPFSNIEAKDYPAMYVTSAFDDGQVRYWQAVKYVARLRELRTDDRPLVFRFHPHGGHNGAARTSEAIAEHAEYIAFVLDQLGIHQ